MTKHAFVAKKPESVDREIRGVLRLLFCGHKSTPDLEEHVSGYVDELVRLREAYGEAGLEVRATIHAIGFVNAMRHGLTSGVERLAERDDFLNSLVPGLGPLELLTKGKITRKLFTSGIKYVRDATSRVSAFEEKHRVRAHADVMADRTKRKEAEKATGRIKAKRQRGESATLFFTAETSESFLSVPRK